MPSMNLDGSNLIATGTTLGTAVPLTYELNYFSSVVSGGTAALPQSGSSARVVVVNRGGNDLSVYPGPGTQIESNGIGVAVTVTNGSNATFYSPATTSTSPNQWWLDQPGSSTAIFATLAQGPSYDNDTQAAAGGIALYAPYRNGNFIMVRLS